MRASPTRATLRGLWGSRAGDVWAVGERGTILHFDGERWAELPSPTEHTLLRVRGTGPRHALAIGVPSWGLVAGQNDALIGWDGDRWAKRKGECPGSGGGSEDQPSVVPLAADDAWTLCSYTGPGNHPLGDDIRVPLNALATAPDGRAFAVGERGIILSRAGPG